MRHRKTDLIARVSLSTNKPRKEVERLLEVVFETIKAMASEGTLPIPKFGTFKMKTRAAWSGRNPKTGAPVQVPKRSVLSFKALRDSK